ncbi:hypothetical protein LWI28_027859 [Acer negundo]|uniref:Gnk2-homologous domain-containing protein n=1 Tax=Acer negundo TaxID=4023 RepID=A0AAD5JHB9_ACENE|nr:hypothetical protein LWI28_027859 [Acer negundo]KAK4858907.1 hypothetical protein QYF36_023678 [Acer negundo]
MLISIGLSSGYEICDTTGNFTANSTYARNLNLLLSSLSSNITVNGGFYNTSIGQDPNKVYGHALCRADVTLEDCGRCVDSTSQEVMTACPRQKAAFMWDGTPACLVRYAERSFFGKL